MMHRLILRFAVCLGLVALSPLLHAADATLPQANLLVELRWVEQSVSGAALQGARQGAVVVGTAGSYSPRGAITLSTRDHEAPPAVQQMLVLNGQQASVQLSETVPLQWLDIGVQTQQAQQSAGAAIDKTRTQAALRQGFVEQTRGFVVSPRWPGGKQPVTVAFRVSSVETGASNAAVPAPRSELSSSVRLPLDQWLTVARQGGSPGRSGPGVLSTRDAEAVRGRELQLRVSLVP